MASITREPYYEYMMRRLSEDDVSEKEEEKEDIIECPQHYARWKIEPITYIMRNDMSFWRGNIIKYATRAGHKQYQNKDKNASEITDLQKVIRYAEMRINQLQGEVDL